MTEVSSQQLTYELVNHLFRHQSGKMVSVLVHILGTHNLDVAEDIVQETLLKALQVWPYHTIPDNPEAWLMQVAKRKAIDYIRKEKYSQRFSPELQRF